MSRDSRDIGEHCARCGSSAAWEECDCCHGDGIEWGDDDCDICDGEGGWWVCLSTPEWCEANPLPGREDRKRGEVET